MSPTAAFATAPCRIHELKPDFALAAEHWDAFWAGEVLDRPVINILAPRTQAKLPGPGLVAQRDELEQIAERVGAWVEAQYWGGDAVPRCWPNLGPDIFAGWLGAKIEDGVDTATNWALPFVEDWEAALPLRLDPRNPAWQRMQACIAALVTKAQGRWVVGFTDLHSNLDALSAIRSPQNLCMDLVDQPEAIERAMRDVRALYAPLSESLYRDAHMAVSGSSGWIGMYSRKKFNVTQCDFSYMIGSDMFRRFVMPALEEETAYLDHSIFHLDGAAALRHLDDLLTLPKLNAIQWVPGAGAKPLREWMDVLRKIINAGKGVHVYCAIDEIEVFHKALGPRGVFYDCWAKSEAEAQRVIEWLRRNT